MAETRDTGESPRRLLTVSEVADRLNVSKPTVYRRIASGELPAIAIGRRTPLRVDPAELAEWVYEEPAA